MLHFSRLYHLLFGIRPAWKAAECHRDFGQVQIGPNRILTKIIALSLDIGLGLRSTFPSLRCAPLLALARLVILGGNMMFVGSPERSRKRPALKTGNTKLLLSLQS